MRQANFLEERGLWGSNILLEVEGKRTWFKEYNNNGEPVLIELEKAENLIIDKALNEDIGIVFLYVECKDGATKGFIAVKYNSYSCYEELKINSMEKGKNSIQIFKKFEERQKKKIPVIFETNVNATALREYILKSPNLKVEHYNDLKVSYEFIEKHMSNIGGYYSDWNKYSGTNKK